MSKLAKLKLPSMESLARFFPSRMAPSGTSKGPEAAPDDGPPKPKAVDREQKVPETTTTTHETSADAAPENLGREIVSYGVQTKEELPKPKVEEPEEILELKTPGFIRLFGCDTCEDSDVDFRHHHAHNSSSDEESDDESPRGSAAHHHQPPHLIPVVHLKVPMKNEDDVRKVVAALQIKGVLEVACDLENQIVKVSGNADPDRLLKKVKKVKRKSKLISYSNPSEMPVPPEPRFHSHIPGHIPLRTPTPPPPPPPPPYAFHRPAYEEQFRPPPQPHGFSRDSHHHGPFGVPPPHVRPNLRPNSAHPRHHYDDEAFYHHQRPAPTVRPPPPNVRAPPFYRDESFYPNYMPPSSPPHYRSGSTYDRGPPILRRSTSPPRRRSYHHETHFRPPPPPPMHHPGGPPPSHHRRPPWSPGVPYCMDDF